LKHENLLILLRYDCVISRKEAKQSINTVVTQIQQ